MPPADPANGERLARVAVREVPLETVLPLRHRMLRVGQAPETARSANDDAPGTRHLAAVAGDTVVGVVTHFSQDSPHAPGRRGERFRGMAVSDAWQGRGIGRALLAAVAVAARDRGAEVLWANGRDSALGFYTQVGFHVAGDGFVDATMHLGHHVVIAALDELRL